MKFERKHAVVLLAVAVWTVVIWARFIRVLIVSDETNKWFYIAHSVLIVVNFGIALVLGSWGWRAFKATRTSPDSPSD
ncbi:MAG: hypothetical protein JWP74_34 [Marmoricola sp.]|nr:hypothetical protein [Marmoricola sp.]